MRITIMSLSCAILLPHDTVIADARSHPRQNKVNRSLSHVDGCDEKAIVLSVKFQSLQHYANKGNLLKS